MKKSISFIRGRMILHNMHICLNPDTGRALIFCLILISWISIVHCPPMCNFCLNVRKQHSQPAYELSYFRRKTSVSAP